MATRQYGRWEIPAIGGFINGDAVPANSCGSFGKVYIGKLRAGQPEFVTKQGNITNECALKVMDMSSNLPKSALEAEKRIMEYVRDDIKLHAADGDKFAVGDGAPFVEIFEGWEQGSQYILAVEKLEGSELWAYLQTATQTGFSELDLRSILKPIFEGLQSLHEGNICHLDLKPENLRFRDVRNTQLVVLDFGLSLHLSFYDPEGVRNRINKPYGTPGYKTKELDEAQFNGTRGAFNTPAADVYAMGVVLFQILHNTTSIFPHATWIPAHPNARLQPNFGQKWPDPAGASDVVKDLLHRMLEVDSNKRITLKDVLEHDWFQVADSVLQQAKIQAPVQSEAMQHDISPEDLRRFKVVKATKIEELKAEVRTKQQTLLKNMAQLMKAKSEQCLSSPRPGHASPAVPASILRFASLNKLTFPDFMKAAHLDSFQDVFEYCDINGDGSVDYREISLLLHFLGFSTDYIVRFFLFTLIDEDESGTVDLDELTRLIRSVVLDAVVVVDQPHTVPDTTGADAAARGGVGGGVDQFPSERQSSGLAPVPDNELETVFRSIADPTGGCINPGDLVNFIGRGATSFDEVLVHEALFGYLPAVGAVVDYPSPQLDSKTEDA